MVLKRYIVNNMQEGIEKIKRELGSDAVILSSKEIKKKGIKGLFSKPKLEVVAAYDEKDRLEIKRTDTPMRRKTAVRPPVQENTVQSDMSNIEDKISNIDNMLNVFLQRFDSNNYNDKFANYSKGVRAFASKLLENEVKDEIICKLCDKITKRVITENIDEADAVNSVISDYLGSPEPIKFNHSKPTVVMFLGTTGVGKTTTLSKLATMFTMQHDKDIAIITVDTYKIASSEQLKVYSQILNVPLSVAYSGQEVKEELEKYRDKDIVFIDTGKCPDEQEYRNNITQLIETAEPDDIYIVVSANTNYKFCAKILDDYSYVKDYKFTVTKMDEAMSCGTLFNLRSLSSKPFAYLTYGQVLTEDIREYSPEYILEKLGQVPEGEE